MVCFIWAETGEICEMMSENTGFNEKTFDVYFRSGDNNVLPYTRIGKGFQWVPEKDIYGCRVRL